MPGRRDAGTKSIPTMRTFERTSKYSGRTGHEIKFEGWEISARLGSTEIPFKSRVNTGQKAAAMPPLPPSRVYHRCITDEHSPSFDWRGKEGRHEYASIKRDSSRNTGGPLVQWIIGESATRRMNRAIFSDFSEISVTAVYALRCDESDRRVVSSLQFRV